MEPIRRLKNDDSPVVWFPVLPMLAHISGKTSSPLYGVEDSIVDGIKEFFDPECVRVSDGVLFVYCTYESGKVFSKEIRMSLEITAALGDIVGGIASEEGFPEGAHGMNTKDALREKIAKAAKAREKSGTSIGENGKVAPLPSPGGDGEKPN